MQIMGKTLMELAKFIESHPDDPEVLQLIHKKRETADPNYEDFHKLLELQQKHLSNGHNEKQPQENAASSSNQ